MINFLKSGCLIIFMKIINYLSILFVLVLFAGCTIDLRGGVPVIEVNDGISTPQIKDKIVEDVTPDKEIVPKEETPETKPIDTTPKNDTVPIVPDTNVTYITISEVQSHNQFNDCWIILEGKVYDAKVLISTHPSGRMVINYCGKDATDFIKNQLFKGDVDFLYNAEGYLKQSYVGNLN